jgi:hypothetical protein
MTIKIASRHGVGLAVLVLIGLTAGLSWSAEPNAKEPMNIVKSIDLDECEPIMIRDKIMEVKPERGTFVVLEREIREIDVEKGGRRIKTSFLGIAGEPEPRDSFGAGQYVLVDGTLHPDGYVAAFVVQKIVKPQDVKFISKPKVESQAKARKTGRAPVAPAARTH